MRKAKEPIKLRSRATSGGSRSLYLDIYMDGARHYEYLKLYLVPEKTKRDREANKQTMQLAEAIKAKRIVELQSGRYGFKENKNKVYALEYYKSLVELAGRLNTIGHKYVWNSSYKVFCGFCTANTAMGDIDEQWCKKYRMHLMSLGVAHNTKNTYWYKFVSFIRNAINDGLIHDNPLLRVENIRRRETERAFLTPEEVNALWNTDCRREVLKRAFLFSCLTGLRKIDVQRLKWGDVTNVGGYTRITFVQKKTKSVEYLDINEQAASLMGARRGNGDLVFEGFRYSGQVSLDLQRWALNAGITKQFSYHASRHTFALMMLDLGVDIYTVSRLLGHHDVKTTQIYAHILDTKKRDAVEKIPFFGKKNDDGA